MNREVLHRFRQQSHSLIRMLRGCQDYETGPHPVSWLSGISFHRDLL